MPGIWDDGMIQMGWRRGGVREGGELENVGVSSAETGQARLSSKVLKVQVEKVWTCNGF